MSHYADSSFLASCYIVDAHTPHAKTTLAQIHAPLAFTSLLRVSLEREHAFRGKLNTHFGKVNTRFGKLNT